MEQLPGNGLGQLDSLLTPHRVYLGLGATDDARHGAYRALFRSELDGKAVADIRMALNQGQPLGESGFIAGIERAIGQRREVRPRGRPRKPVEETASSPAEQLWMDI